MTTSRRSGKRGRKPAKIDVKAKLERSRQSARECRARKKLRYQYLEELVSSRERAIFSLRRELELCKQWCVSLDKGNLPPEVLQRLEIERKQGMFDKTGGVTRTKDWCEILSDSSSTDDDDQSENSSVTSPQIPVEIETATPTLPQAVIGKGKGPGKCTKTQPRPEPEHTPTKTQPPADPESPPAITGNISPQLGERTKAILRMLGGAVSKKKMDMNSVQSHSSASGSSNSTVEYIPCPAPVTMTSTSSSPMDTAVMVNMIPPNKPQSLLPAQLVPHPVKSIPHQAQSIPHLAESIQHPAQSVPLPMVSSISSHSFTTINTSDLFSNTQLSSAVTGETSGESFARLPDSTTSPPNQQFMATHALTDVDIRELLEIIERGNRSSP